MELIPLQALSRGQDTPALGGYKLGPGTELAQWRGWEGLGYQWRVVTPPQGSAISGGLRVLSRSAGAEELSRRGRGQDSWCPGRGFSKTHFECDLTLWPAVGAVGGGGPRG